MKIAINQRSVGLSLRTGWVAVAAAVLLVACVDTPPPTRKSSNLAPSGAAVKMDPRKANATASVETREQTGIAKGAYPSLTMTLNGADYAEVWRCAASFKLVYGNGLKELSSVAKSDPEYTRIAKESFERMRTEGSSCEAISINASTPQINDYGARSGNFYYVINPCVSASNSSTGAGGCSYALQITSPLTYTNTRAKAEVEILSGMYQAEGNMYALFNEMKDTIESMNAIATTCVLDEADRIAAAQRNAGWMKLISSVAGAVVNTLVPGVGTLLDAAVKGIIGLQQQRATAANFDCPGAKDKQARYDELSAQVATIAQEVLEKRQKLAQMDAQYAAVDKQLAELKSSLAK
ncbi:MAG: hypothetical protein FJY29_02505 [Betaproteobacteria bacterium]|nr:hypothetical protein [Betaproteobacteria bacterium]